MKEKPSWVECTQSIVIYLHQQFTVLINNLFFILETQTQVYELDYSQTTLSVKVSKTLLKWMSNKWLQSLATNIRKQFGVYFEYQRSFIIII